MHSIKQKNFFCLSIYVDPRIKNSNAIKIVLSTLFAQLQNQCSALDQLVLTTMGYFAGIEPDSMEQVRKQAKEASSLLQSLQLQLLVMCQQGNHEIKEQACKCLGLLGIFDGDALCFRYEYEQYSELFDAKNYLNSAPSSSSNDLSPKDRFRQRQTAKIITFLVDFLVDDSPKVMRESVEALSKILSTNNGRKALELTPELTQAFIFFF